MAFREVLEYRKAHQTKHLRLFFFYSKTFDEMMIVLLTSLRCNPLVSRSPRFH